MTRTINSVLFICLLYKTTESVNPRFYPKFHLAPPRGWMNDPNGLSIFDGVYHLSYQYNPYSSQEPGIANWGHAISPNLFNWTHLPIELKPDKEYDRSGVFSGSAIVENNTMFMFYTGNVNHEGQTPDHEQRQALAWSHDGVTAKKYEGNPIIIGEEYQPNIRDPKVWKHEDDYYMVLGNSYENNTMGRVLLFTSKDMIHWKKVSTLGQSNGYLGYMWECPDFFELNGRFVLLISPQGIPAQGIKYNNLYQTGYIVGDFDYKCLKFTPVTEFRELDHGHDFYATQTMEDLNGDRVMFAWADMWEQNYPERNDGFTGHMTIPRYLSLDKDLRLIQTPVHQIRDAVGRKLHCGKTLSDTTIPIEGNAGMIDVKASGRKDFILILEVNGEPVVTITYDYDQGLVTLDRGGDDGKRSALWRPKRDLHWKLYVDASSVELFCGEGSVTFTSRFFPNGTVNVSLGEKSVAYEMSVYKMLHTAPAAHES